MVGKVTESAVLTVNGRNYGDWATVEVVHALGERPPYLCRFTCSEPLPIAKNFATLQIKPGDVCTVTLAGFPAFKGKVMTRQVYYDASRHHVEIIAGTFDHLSTASVPSKTGEWKDKTFPDIAKEILGKAGVGLKFENGPPPTTRFPRASSMIGESIDDFLEMLARNSASKNGIHFTSDVNENFVCVMGPGSATDSVVEGDNILIGREIMYNPAMAGSNPVVAQGSGSDKAWGADVAHVPYVKETFETFGKQFLPGVIMGEIATADKDTLKSRANNETKIQEGDQVTCIITVYGWLRPSGGLWERAQKVIVTSPMLMLKNETLYAKKVTFTQDNERGTRTTLHLTNNIGMAPSVPTP